MRLLPLATRNLLRNPRRTAISLAALVVGVGALVGLRGFINGQQRAVLENIVLGQVGALQVHRAGYLANVQASPLTLDLEDSPGLRARLADVAGVTGVAPRIVFGSMLSLPDGAEGEAGRTGYLLVTAYEPELEPRVTPRRLTWLVAGEHLSGVDAPGLLLDADMARSLGAQVRGARTEPDTWPALLAADREGVLNGEAVRLTGTLVGAPLGDQRQGYVPLGTAQRVLRMEGRVTEYALSVEDLGEVHAVRDAARAALGPGYEVHAWDDVLPFVAQLARHQDFVFAVITAVFLVTVLLGVVNVMLMNVLERVREIGTLLAVGLKRRHVVSLFLLEGAVLGLLGGVLGAAVGWGATWWLGRHGIHLPSSDAASQSVIRPFVSAGYVARAVGLATVGAALAALWPAWRAAQLRPVEALAHV
ncbi:ABC transporter permease [Archangium primigenium]|uniref:ABC transporter permease n=1 Tax=[Archangium] primigenium TaxID=2792470 RepID=UPI00195E7BEB|nr:FtsX-like permease family protein [Archangium primigenium]MBM7118884.1 FtsX-like permease family protein [Archangium primigenium]